MRRYSKQFKDAFENESSMIPELFIMVHNVWCAMCEDACCGSCRVAAYSFKCICHGTKIYCSVKFNTTVALYNTVHYHVICKSNVAIHPKSVSNNTRTVHHSTNSLANYISLSELIGYRGANGSLPPIMVFVSNTIVQAIKMK